MKVTFFRSITARLLMISIAALLLFSACGPAASTSSTPGSPTTVKLALDWIPNTNHTGIYTAIENGYYKQQNMNVQLVPYGSVYPETLVATGQADFAVSFEESVAIDRAQGLPIVSIAAVMQHDTSAMATLASSGITRPAQFVGKTFASSGDPAEQAVIDIMEANDGASSVGYNSVVVNNADVSSLLTGHFNFVWIYQGVEGVMAKDAGVQLNMFSLQEYGVPDFYSPVLITSEQMIKNHPDIVRRFLAATSEGYTFAAQHPSQSADLFVKAAGGINNTEFASTQVAEDSQKFQSQYLLDSSNCWGTQTLPMWTGFPTLLYRVGALTDANNKPLTSPPDYAAMFTNQFLPHC